MDLNKPVNIFVKEKPVMAVLAIQKSHSEIYPSKVSKQIDSTYSHTVNILSKMEENEIVETQKEGRKRILSLTSRGEAYADILTELMEIDGSSEVNFANNGNSLDFLNDKEKAKKSKSKGNKSLTL